MMVRDEGGIQIFYGRDNHMTIHFWNKDQYEKLVPKMVDENTLWGRSVSTEERPYLFNFLAQNFDSLGWEDKKNN
jgi:hypothetical protein